MGKALGTAGSMAGGTIVAISTDYFPSASKAKKVPALTHGKIVPQSPLTGGIANVTVALCRVLFQGLVLLLLMRGKNRGMTNCSHTMMVYYF